MVLLPGVFSCYLDDAFCGWAEGLTEVPMGIPPNVKNVLLHRNEITSIPSGIFSNLTESTYLNLERNKIAQLGPGMFEGLVSLTSLKFSRNRISTIEPGTFDPLGNLNSLWLDRNKITEVDVEMWRGLVSLEKIILEYNRISLIRTDSFVNPENQHGDSPHPLHDLETLDLNYNDITEMEPGAISGLKKLAHLYLGHNKLKEISGANLNGSCEITDLWLWGNELTTVKKDTFLGVLGSSVGRIKLELNKITNIEAEAFSGTSARILDLGGNDLSDLRADMWHGMDSLETLRLDLNEFD